MRCPRCDTRLEQGMLFCPECGYPIEDEAELCVEEDALLAADEALNSGGKTPPGKIADAPPEEEHNVQDEAAPASADIPAESIFDVTRTSPPTRRYEHESPGAVTRMYGGATYPEDNFDVRGAGVRHGAPRASSVESSQRWASIPDLFPEPGVVPESDPREKRRTQYGDGYEQRGYRRDSGRTGAPAAADPADEDNFDDPDAGRDIPRTSAGKKVASVFLCIFTILLLLFTAPAGALRLAVTGDNIRAAADGEKLAHKSLISDSGIVASSEYMRELIGAEAASRAGLNDDSLRAFMRGSSIPELVGSLMTDYAEYVLSGTAPTHLNAEYITGKMAEINSELAEASGYDIKLMDADALSARINGGDLSFLSIDGEGGAFKGSYGVSPTLLSTLGSLPVLIICGSMALLCIVFIIIINGGNLSYGFRCSAAALLTVGLFSLLTAGGLVIVSLIYDIWILTELSRYLALWLGVIGVGLFIAGVVLTAIAGSLRRKAERRMIQSGRPDM